MDPQVQEQNKPQSDQISENAECKEDWRIEKK
jgi:hypothetical protein